jgi:D-methionine transport system substrate-binding protein
MTINLIGGMNMKKIISLVLVLTLVGAFFVGCGKKSETDKAGADVTKAADVTQATAEPTKAPLKTITVGASATPHAEILEQAKPALEAAGLGILN